MNSKVILTKIKSMITIILLVIVINSIIFTVAQNNFDAQSRSQPKYQFSQIEIIQPNLFITEVIINEGNLPEEGDIITIDLEITNADNVTYVGLDLILKIEENVLVQHGPKPAPEVHNKSVSVIPSLRTISEQMSFISNFGQYTLTASLASNGSVLPKSVNTMVFQVINQPIGSITSLLIVTFSIVFLLLALIPIPLIFEKLKYKYEN